MICPVIQPFCRCGKVVQRHSKSIDVEKQVCGGCKGVLQFLGSFNVDGTPKAVRPANGYCQYVKDNIASVRQQVPKGTLAPLALKSTALCICI